MKEFYYKSIWLACFLLLATESFAQELPGLVQDMAGRPLPGVSIRLRGKIKKTALNVALTGADGRFVLSVGRMDTIMLHKSGFLDRDIVVFDNSFLKVTMRREVEEIDEVKVVSTGYRTQALEKATGSFEQVGKALINRSVSTGVLDRLNGVSTVQFDTRVGQQGNLTIRGRSTLFAGASPLIVLDNFPYNGDINNINPNDVESISILKDASAAAIWGVRASNGVIVITTKKGAKNRPMTVNFNANVNIAQKPDVFYLPRMSSSDFVGLEKDLFAKGFYSDDEQSYAHTALSPVVELLIAKRDGTMDPAVADRQIGALAGRDIRNDLQKYWYRKAVNQQYALSMSGGSDKNTYFFSAGYDRNLSSLDGHFQRLNLRADNSFYWGKRLQLDAGVLLTSSKTLAGRSDPSSLISIDGKKPWPYARIADDHGNALPLNLDYRESFIKDSEAQGFLDWNYKPLDDYKHIDNRSDQFDLLLNTALKYNIGYGFDAELRYQLESSQTQGSWLYGADSYYVRNTVNQYTQTADEGTLSRPVPVGGIMDASDSKLLSNSFRAQLNFKQAWGRHRLSMLGGYEYRNDHTRSRSFRDYGYNPAIEQASPVDYQTSFLLSNYSYFIDSTIPYLNAYGDIDNYNLSWFGDAGYSFDDRYSLSGSIRRDESNLFGVNANQKGVPLYSAGLAWTISKEHFYRAGWMPRLKLRATYGYSGNVDNTLAAQTTIRYNALNPLSGQFYASVQNPPNPSLGWEKTGILNLAVDFSAFGDVLSGSVEYYRKRAKDLIGFQPLDQTTGVLNPATNQYQFKGNVAEMAGHGWELNLHSNNLGMLPFRWQTDLLFSHAANHVTKYYQASDLAATYAANGITVSPLVGKPVYAILAYKWAGLDPQTGDPQGYLNGQVSKDYNAILAQTKVNDLQYIGSGVPTYFGNFRNTFSYKGIALSANIAYRFGYYFMRQGISYNALINNRDVATGDYALRWQKPGDETHTSVPSFVYPVNSRRDQFYSQSAVNAEKGDNIRLQDLRLSYDAGGKLPERIGMKRLQVYLYAANLGLLWKATKTGLDPDYPYAFKLPKTVALGFTGTF